MRDNLLEVITEVSKEKALDRDIMIRLVVESIVQAAKRKLPYESIEGSFNKRTGQIELFQYKEVVDVVDDDDNEVSLDEVQEIDPEAQIGDEVEYLIDEREFNRIARSARSIIFGSIREAEREMIVSTFEKRVGEVLTGTVLRSESNGRIALRFLDKTDAYLFRREQIPGENFSYGDHIRVYLMDVNNNPQKPSQLSISRTHPGLLIKLFEMEVPEIYDGLIEIKSSSRDPGSRAKICVKAVDTSLDPVGACVGMRGSRVQAVVNELQGEKIDIVNWSEDPAILVSNALSPAEVQRVNVDAQRKKLDVILTEENLSKAIGRRGQNVRLATKLLNYEINIMTDAEDSERRQLEFKEKTENFVKNLELDETLGQLLVAEGFSTIDDIKDSSAENLMKIEGIEEDTAKALIERAQEFHQKDQEDISTRIKELGLEDTLINLKGLTPGMLVTLGEQKILTLEDFADLASDELTGGFDVVKGEKIRIQGYLEDFALSKTEADNLIMSARDIVYKDFDHLDVTTKKLILESISLDMQKKEKESRFVYGPEGKRT